VAMREQGYIAIGLQRAIDYCLGATGYLIDSFATRHTVAEQIPAGPAAMDFVRGVAFICAVVPFGEVGLDLAFVSKTCEFTCSARPLQRAGQDFREGMSGERGPDSHGSFFAGFG